MQALNVRRLFFLEWKRVVKREGEEVESCVTVASKSKYMESRAEEGSRVGSVLPCQWGKEGVDKEDLGVLGDAHTLWTAHFVEKLVSWFP
jgi:hypothetical protein